MNNYDEAKVITHEEARKHIDNIEPSDKDCERGLLWVYLVDTISLRRYIAQQDKKEERAKKVEEMLDIYKRNYQVQMCLNDRLRLIEIEKELEEMK